MQVQVKSFFIFKDHLNFFWFRGVSFVLLCFFPPMAKRRTQTMVRSGERRFYHISTDVSLCDGPDQNLSVILESSRTYEVLACSFTTNRAVIQTQRHRLSFEFDASKHGWNYWLHCRFRDFQRDRDHIPSTHLLDHTNQLNMACMEDGELMSSGSLYGGRGEHSQWMEFVPENADAHHWLLCAIADGRPWKSGERRMTVMNHETLSLCDR
jgi:hypothetical protein